MSSWAIEIALPYLKEAKEIESLDKPELILTLQDLIQSFSF